MKQQALDLLVQGDRQTLSLTSSATIRDRILESLQVQQLPSHLMGTEALLSFSIWPEAYDLMFLVSAVNDYPASMGFADAEHKAVTRCVYQLVNEGRVIEDRHFYGSDQPGDPEYRGWSPVFRLAEVVSA